jgi:hypothetical protein
MRNVIYLVFAAFLFAACTEGIDLDLRQSPPRVVIEGLVTNSPGYQAVKVTRSTEFYGKGQSPRVTNAIVEVTDDLGQVFSFVHNPNNHKDSAGIYVAKTFVGSIGRTYSLRVEVDGQVYEAEDQMTPVLTPDSIRYRVNDEQVADPIDEGKIYEILLYAKEPQQQINFYLFKFYRNDSLTFLNDTDIYYSDDEFLAEHIDGIPSPIFYAKNDTARVEILSLSRQGYVFYNDLAVLLSNDAGGMFGPIPGSPRTNLSNNALGFFQVSALSTSEIKIE